MGTREEKNAAEGRKGIIKLITEAKDYPEPKKNLIKGLRFRRWNPEGEGKILHKAKILQTKGKVTYKGKNQAGSTPTSTMKC